MEAKNSRQVKPGTAKGPSSSSRPLGRSQNRTTSKPSGRKNSRVICDGSALLGGGGRASTKASDAASNSLYKNLPTAGRTSDIFNPAPTTKKDGFLVHKRGQGTYRANSKPRGISNDSGNNEIVAIGGRRSTKTIDQLARENSASQALNSQQKLETEENEDPNDTTAISDMNSCNNFSYYGRGFYNRNQRVQESPAASDAVSMTYGGQYTKPVASFTQNVQQNKAANQNQAADTVSDNNASSMAGFYGRKSVPPSSNIQLQQDGGSNAEYAVEQKMSSNLMKQFQPMLTEDRSITLRHSRQDNNMLNSVSDFSMINGDTSGQLHHQTQQVVAPQSTTSRGGSSQTRAQLFAQAKETLMMQRSGGKTTPQNSNSTNAPQAMAQTVTTGFKRKTSRSKRDASGSMSRAQNLNMTKTTQNFMPKKGTAAAGKVLPPKLPPRGAMSPAVNSLKSKNLSNQKNLLASQYNMSSSKPTEVETPFKDNLYFAHQQSKMQTQQTPQTETVYRKGARSISRKRMEPGSGTLTSQKDLQLLNTSVQVESRGNLRDKNLTTEMLASESRVSLDQRLEKFNQNFTSTGHCKRHNVIGCDKCSFGSSKGSRVSSLDSANALISRDILKKHKVAPRSEIGIAQAKVTKSVTRQFKRPQNQNGARNLSMQQSLDAAGPPLIKLGAGRANSLPREQSSTLNADSSIMEKANDLRRSTKNSEVRNLTGKLIGFGKKGNRPSAKCLPKSSSYAISEVKVNIKGRQDSHNRIGSSDSRGMSEMMNPNMLRQQPNTAIPNFSRILSAKTSIVRQDISKQLVQNDHQDLLQNDVKKLAEEWEGDPHDPEFWKRFEGENSQTQLQKRQLVQGQEIKSKQLDLIDKQNNVFQKLRETDELMSERASSMRGTQMGFGARSSVQGGIMNTKTQAMSRQSQQDMFTNTMQPGGQDEPIQTEIDQQEFSVYQHDGAQFGASIVQGNRRLLQDPSLAVLTDYDITDEIGTLGQSVKHQLDFRDKNANDKVALDQNIEDLLLQQQKQRQQQLLQESQNAYQISDATNLFSGQTKKSKANLMSPAMQLGDIASAQRESGSQARVSNRTGNFPSEKNSSKNTERNNNQMCDGDVADLVGPTKPSCFENQGGDGTKDSEDADSFDEEKQKTQMLKELDLAGEVLETEIVDQTKENGDKVSEKSNDDEDEKRKKEIQDATLANVVDYDDWLEARTQKEIERQSQMEDARQSKNGGFSPKSTISIPKNGVIDVKKMDQTGDSRQLNNMTQHVKSVDKLAMSEIDDETGTIKFKNAATKTLADTIQEQNMKNVRPKTRGNPAIQILETTVPEPTGELSSKNATANSNFSARRRTQDDASDQNNFHSKTTAFNATQIAQNKDYNQSMKSPEKRFLGLGGTHLMQQSSKSKGMITSEQQVRSNAQMTVMASSLREDDLMISASNVDPTEGARSIRAKSKLDATDKSKARVMMDAVDNLAIQEESSSLKSVSPLTENSMSKKSLMISGSPATFNEPPAIVSNQQLPVFDSTEQNQTNLQQQLPPQSVKRLLPPKSPQILSNKIKQAENINNVASNPVMPVIEEKSLAEENYISFAGAQPKNNQPDNNAGAVRESYSGAKPPIGQNNQAVHDFLAFEDSDDDDFGVIVKNNSKPISLPPMQDDEPRPPQMVDNENNNEYESSSGVIRLSPQRPSNLAKTPSAQFHPNTQFLKSNPNTMPALGPALAEEVRKQVAKTPNTGLSNPKIKALQVEMNRNNTAKIPPVPLESRNSIDDSLNEQLDRIDYNQSNDGMSASFYRNHDQWLALQQMGQTHQTLKSHRSSREGSRQQNQMAKTQQEVARAGSQTRNEVHSQTKIVDQANEANKQVQEMRKSLQSLPKQGQNQIPVRRDEELRQSGTAVAAGYQRPQAYVKKAIQKQNSKNNLNSTETSQERQKFVGRQSAADKFSNQRDGSTGRQGNVSFRQNNSIMSTDSRGNKSNKKQQFFNKHKDSIGEEAAKTQKKRESSQDARAASKNRLYNQETIASILKRNPELGYNAKDKKPPTMPPRRPAKKKVVKPPTPEPPKEDPPEEPLAQSPRVLQLPIEASVPGQEGAPTNMPLPMRLPEEPPSEPIPYVMPNLYCPVDPDTPFNFEIEPREEEQHFAPLEPVSLRMPFEPEDPPYPERMIKMNTAEYMSEMLELDDCLRKISEPCHDDEPMLEYPRQERVLVMPPPMPDKREPDSCVYLDEPLCEEPDVQENEPQSHYLTQDQVDRTHEMSIQCDNPEEESKALTIIQEEQSDEDNFSVHSCEGVINKVTVGIQTNEAHFRNVERSKEYEKQRQQKLESIDWAFSPIFDEIHFAKEKKTIGGRKLMTSIATQVERFEDGGNQVEQDQIIEETSVQILSQIECEYNVDQLKRKMSGKDAIEDERLTELYVLGLNTLKALMLGLRLNKEWEFQTKHQYVMPSDGAMNDPEETIKLLIRNKKMYEAKTLIQRLLKMIVQRDQMVEEATKLEQPAQIGGAITANISLKKPQAMISRDSMAQIKRLSTRITSQINTLQEEHRIFKRPFILQGQEYLDKIQEESNMLEKLLNQKFFVDESGTTGAASQQSSSFKSAKQSQ